MDKEHFGKLITALRKKQGMSQKELAEKLAVSTSALCKWEHGNNLPDTVMIKSMAEIFQMSCDELLNPEETLMKLTHPEPEVTEKEGDKEKEDTEIEEQKEQEQKKKSQRHKAVGMAIIAAVVILAAGVCLFYQSHKEPTFQQIGTRYIDDPAWGRVYEVAIVVEGEMDSEAINIYTKETGNMIEQNQKLETDVVKISYYANENTALNWEETEIFGYYFLNVK